MVQPDAGSTIVVVDGDPFVADVLMYALREGLGPTICAVTPDHAESLIGMARWRLAVIDAMTRGVEIAREAARRGTPVLLVTADFATAEKLRRYGFAVLQKPMSMDCLVQEARAAVARAWLVCQSFARAADSMEQGEGSLWC